MRPLQGVPKSAQTAGAAACRCSESKELLINKLNKIAAGFLSSGGVGKPQECLLPFKVLPRRMAAKRQGKMCKLFTNSS